ncbi:high-affinity iron transporter [Seinonella peptonophila]|uniref:High-affinity iron transporter n=1 Tax=Seinonella peptonophila TaxID=112248 RepID=A0A1M4YKS4_9BACL|nr:FTR1 family protein [Seinonella peptonophila]SHF06455.1 high-affinity iron transporter [Seinonella peptonophila]
MSTSLHFQAFFITFREVFEAMLILGLITSYIKRVNQEKWNKWVWTGAGTAVIASLIVALLFQLLLNTYATMGSEIYLKISILLISCILLTQMVFWMADQNQDIKGQMEKRLDVILTTGSAIGMVMHAFLVVLREGVETVFFFAAISQGQIDRVLTSWGALIGLIGGIVLAFLFFRGMARFSLRTFFRVTGSVILLIAAGFLVNALGMLQDLKHLPSAMPHVFDLSWLMPESPIDEAQYIREHGTAPLISGNVGIFFSALLGYTHQPSIEQLCAYLTYFVVVILWVRYRHQRKQGQAKQPSLDRKEEDKTFDVSRL